MPASTSWRALSVQLIWSERRDLSVELTGETRAGSWAEGPGQAACALGWQPEPAGYVLRGRRHDAKQGFTVGSWQRSGTEAGRGDGAGTAGGGPSAPPAEPIPAEYPPRLPVSSSNQHPLLR